LNRDGRKKQKKKKPKKKKKKREKKKKKKESPQGGSNPRSTAYEAVALPLGHGGGHSR
jgi:hypothetical protein